VLLAAPSNESKGVTRATNAKPPYHDSRMAASGIFRSWQQTIYDLRFRASVRIVGDLIWWYCRLRKCGDSVDERFIELLARGERSDYNFVDSKSAAPVPSALFGGSR
jgi:hypothetical protein